MLDGTTSPLTLLALLSPTLLDNQLVQLELLCCPLQNALLHCVLGNKAEDVYLLGLPNTVCSVHRLQVCLGVPVGIEQDDDVGGNEVDAETTSTRGKQEDELFATRGVVLVNRCDTILVCGVTINAAVF